MEISALPPRNTDLTAAFPRIEFAQECIHCSASFVDVTMDGETFSLFPKLDCANLAAKEIRCDPLPGIQAVGVRPAILKTIHGFLCPRSPAFWFSAVANLGKAEVFKGDASKGRT